MFFPCTHITAYAIAHLYFTAGWDAGSAVQARATSSWLEFSVERKVSVRAIRDDRNHDAQNCKQ